MIPVKTLDEVGAHASGTLGTCPLPLVSFGGAPENAIQGAEGALDAI